MLPDSWWDDRTYPFGPVSTADELTLAWRRARVAHDVVWRWHAELGITPLPLDPQFGSGGQEPMVLASPLCKRSPRAFARLGFGDRGWTQPRVSSTGWVAVNTAPGSLEAPGPWADLRKPAFAAFRLEATRAPGHELCFHRRAKDITPVMWTIALLLRTSGGRTWQGPLTWDALLTATVNGHTLSAVYPALGPEEEQTHYAGSLSAVPADGRAIVVYTPMDWAGVVLSNDGIARTRGTVIDFGHWWRAGEDIVEIARNLAERAHLPTEPGTH